VFGDLYRRGEQVEAVLLDGDPARPARLICADTQRSLPAAAWSVIGLQFIQLNGDRPAVSCK
jgi:hypothetical protein